MTTCPNCGGRTVEATRVHTLHETMRLRYLDDQGSYEEEDAGSFGESIDQGPWKDRTCMDCSQPWPDEPEARPTPTRWWILTHQHCHGVTQTIFSHSTEPDMDVMIAYAVRVLDYEEDRDDEWLTVIECDPFLTYADIEAEAHGPSTTKETQ